MRSIAGSLARKAQSTLAECIKEMKTIVEPCDHDVGICWCGYQAAMQKAQEVYTEIDEALS